MTAEDVHGLKGVIGRAALAVAELLGIAMGGGQAAAAPDIANLQQDSFAVNPSLVLSASVLAEMVVKNLLDEGTAASEARMVGLDAERFGLLAQMTGNPPGPETLLDLWRRGIIDDARMIHGLRQGYLKNEWTDTYEARRFDLPPTSQLVEGVVQSHIDEGTATNLASQAGNDPDHFRLYVDNAGNPPGPMEMLTMLNRGIMSQAEVEQGLRESRLKNKYIPGFLQLARRRVPMRTVTTLIGHGAIDENTARDMLRQLGYSDEDASAIVLAAHHTATSTSKEASLTTVRSLYVDRIISRDEAAHDLVGLGYTEHAADLILQLADSQALQRLRNAVITKLRSIFVAHHLSKDAARHDLSTLGMPVDQIDYLLELWTLERDANVRSLTAAQLVAAGKKGLLSPDEVVAELIIGGYSQRDATILAMEGGAMPIPTTGGTNA